MYSTVVALRLDGRVPWITLESSWISLVPKWWPTRVFVVCVPPGRCKKFFSWLNWFLCSTVLVLRLDGRVHCKLVYKYCLKLFLFSVGFLCICICCFYGMKGNDGLCCGWIMVWGSLLLLWSMCDLIYKSLLRSIIFFLQLSVVFLWKSLNIHYLFQLFLNYLIVLRDVIDITVTIEVWNLSGWFSSMCLAVSKKIKLLIMFVVIGII